MLLACITFPAGGVYTWVWVPVACTVLLLAVRVRPAIAADARVGAVDAALIVTCLAIAVQLVPLPYVTLRSIDPHAVPVRAALWLVSPDEAAGMSWLPISILPRATTAALGIFGAGVLFYWVCREICGAGGLGRIVRAIAFIGVAASIAAIIQRAESKELLYGIWKPLDAGARPYGPFVNRNHFATWAVMACPVIFGYLLARAPRPRERSSIAQRLVAAAEQLGSMRTWLAVAVCLMTLAVVLSTSRSGLIGLTGAFIATGVLSPRTFTPYARRWRLLQVALLAGVILAFANFDALLGRVDQTIADEQAGRGRAAIWSDTERMIRDFPLTGTGAGTFGSAIVAYQTAAPGYNIGQAHNHYLQLAAEGGALVAVPVLMSTVGFIVLFQRRLAEDRTAAVLIRSGAAAGMAGALLQSFWETGLRMPANAMLFAALAAIATYTPATD